MLATSTVFLAFSAQASSDMLFFAALFGTLLAVVAAMASPHWAPWALAGLLAGLTFLLRTNGIVLLVLALAPWLVRSSIGGRIRDGLVFLASALVPIVAWAIIAQSTQSPVFPTETHSNLALTYFGDRGTAPHDQRLRLGEEFDSTLDVLLADPIQVMRIYIADLVKLPARIVLHAAWLPLAILSALCLLYLAPWLRSRAGIVVLVIALLSTLLMNMKQFESRYYLYLTPVLGAALGVAMQRWQARAAVERRANWLLAGLVLAIVMGMVPAARAARAMAEPPRESREIAAVVAAVESKVPAGRPIVARKNLVTFYSGRPLIWFPEAVTLDGLCDALRRDGHDGSAYLLIGAAERRIRPEVAAQVLAGELPGWARLAASGGPAGAGWALVELALGACGSASGSPRQAVVAIDPAMAGPAATPRGTR